MNDLKNVKRVRINISDMPEIKGQGVVMAHICTLEPKRRTDWKF